MTVLPDTQLVLRPGIVGLNSGSPDPALLPVEEIARAAELALRRDGPRALAYGAERGPGRLIEPLAAWLAQREKRPPAPEHLFVTGGVSQALDLLCTLFTRPGDAVLVESPTYHLALRIFRDHGLDLVPVQGDKHGLRLDALAVALETLRDQGRPPRFLYTVPTFSNPTGASLATDRRAALVALAEELGLLILEDDVYRELWYDAPAPAALQSPAAPGTVIRLGSFSKLLAPGLRLGWLIAAPEMIQRCMGCGMLDSGGGVNHFTAHVVAAYLDQGWLDSHIDLLRATYRAAPRRPPGRARALHAGRLLVDCAGRRFLRLGSIARTNRQRRTAPGRGASRRVVRAGHTVLCRRGWRAVLAAGVQPVAGGRVGRGGAAVGGCDA